MAREAEVCSLNKHLQELMCFRSGQEMKSLRVSKKAWRSPYKDHPKEIHTETHHNPTANSERRRILRTPEINQVLSWGSNAPNERKFLVRNSGANRGQGSY